MNQNDAQELFEYREALMELARTVGRRQPLDEADYKFYYKKLADLPWPIVRDAMDLLGREMKYFPAVTVIRERSARLVNARRQEAYMLHLKDCPHGESHFEEVIVDGVTRLQKCACLRNARAAADAIGQPIALPAARPETTQEGE